MVMLSGCGVPNAFARHAQTQAGQTSGGASVQSQPVALPLPPAINQKMQPTKQPIALVKAGTTGDAALLINEALATLHYLPLQFSSDEQNASSSAQNLKLASQLEYGKVTPPSGSWKWTANYPAAMTGQWNPNTANVITQGAIMDFERKNGLVIDGVAGPSVDIALCTALRKNAVNTQPYVYVMVSKSSPERLEVWSNGHKVYSTLANTGIAAAPTPNGTYPVYARYQSKTMRGTNPDGTKYSDPGVPWINYFYRGDAVHGFPRNSYGSPQSLGCVELPIQHAKVVYGMINYGTLVTITN